MAAGLLLLAGYAICWIKPARPANPAISAQSSTVAMTPAKLVTVVPVPVTNQPVAQPLKFTRGPVSHEGALAAVDAFAHWAGEFSSNNPAASVMHGEALAWQRREAMLQLIQTDPAQALALAVPYAWRQEMPADITRFFEQQVDGRGAYNVLAGTDFSSGSTTTYRYVQVNGQSYEAFVYGWRQSEVSQASIPVHGIAIEGKLAVSTEPLRQLTVAEASTLDSRVVQPEDVICSVSGKPATSRGSPVYAESGGGVLCFCGEDHYKLVNQQWTLAESGGGGIETSPGSFDANATATAANDAWTHGNKTVLYMRVNFPDDLTEPISEADAYSQMDGVNAYYTVNSYDLSSLTATVTPLLTLPQVKAYYSPDPTLLLADARAVAAAAGYQTTNFDRDIVAFTSVPGYTFGGLAYVHGKGVWLQSMDVGVTAHELGHNYGLWHANFWNALTNFSGIGPGTNLEYGNLWDTMGSGGVAYFNVIHKNALDWLKADAIQSISSNGVYRIYPMDVPGSHRVDGRMYAAALRKDTLRNYWLEFRRQYPDNPWLLNGLLVYWSPWKYSNGGAQIVDTTPGSPNADDNFSREDAALVIGRTFNDQAAGVHITPVQSGLTGTDPYIDFQVNLGRSTTNQPPVLAIQVDLTNVPVNTLVHFHATASDPNGDPLAYSWTFDDLTFSTNNEAWTSKAFTSSGDHVVRCVVSDMKGNEASANAVVTVGAPGGAQITGYVTDPDGNPLEGVLVGNGSLSATNFIGGYTDSDGQYVLANITGPFNLNAYEFGYVFSNAVTWANPIDATNSVSDIDFTGYPLPAVNVTSDVTTISEGDQTVHQFTITRTGDASNDLDVQIDLSGSATIGTDYSLTPDLTGVSDVIIPAGTNSVSFALRAIDDPSALVPQTVTLTVLDDTNMDEPSYCLAPLAEATVTFTNPSPPSIATVNVTTPTPDILENDMDNGQLIFSREGSSQGDLLVYYTISGTAVAGVNYTPLPGVVLIPAGQSSTTVPLIPIDDYRIDPDESVTVNITANSSYETGSSASAQILILDDDYTTVSVSATENTAQPSAPGVFTVQRNGDLSSALVVNYGVGGTAVAGTDYNPLRGSLTIPAGQASAAVEVKPLSSAVLNGNQTVTIYITNSPEYDPGPPDSATVTILDPTVPTVSVVTTVDNIAKQGNQFGVFTFTRTGTTGDLPVYFSISGTAGNGVNYVPISSPVVIPDGSSSATLNIIPFQDEILESTQTVIINLETNAAYNLGSSVTASMNILDDGTETLPGVGFCFASSAYPERQSPGIAVELSVTSAVPVSVDYAVIGGTAPAYRYSLPQGTLTLPAGTNIGFVPLQINPTNAVLPPQTVEVAVFNPVNATLAGIKLHTYTILNDNSAAVSVTALTNTAYAASGSVGDFRISRVGPTNAGELVNFEVTGTAAAPDDYVPIGDSIVIPAGATYVDVPVIPVNQEMLWSTQTVAMTLSSATNGTIASPNAAMVTIIDNYTNVLPAVSVTSSNQPYAYTGGGNGQFVFTRTGPLTNALTVSFMISGTASSGTNYEPIPNSVTIPAGQSNAVLTIVPVDDHRVEGDRTVILSLIENGTYHADYPSSATVTVQDNDQSVQIDASDFAAAKPDTPGAFTFTRFGSTNLPVTVWYTIGGTATDGVEYVFITNSVVIPAGDTTAVLPILPIEDGVVEGPRTVILTLQANFAYVLGTPTNGVVTINDDEPMIVISALATNVLTSGGSNGVFRITRYGDPKFDFTAYLVVGGTATYGLDYSVFPTNVYFSCGVTSIDLTFSATNYSAPAGTLTALADLVPNPAYTILSPSNALINIIDPGPGQVPEVTITNPATAVSFIDGTNAGLILGASVMDDSPTNTVVTWSEIGGPGTVTFDNTNAVNTGAIFSEPGVYQLQLAATNVFGTNDLVGAASLIVVVSAAGINVSNALHWPFDDGMGTNVTDTSGFGRNGTFSGDPAWTTNGVLGDALIFNGTNDCVVQSAGSNLLNGLNSFTISLWVRPNPTNFFGGLVTGDDASTNVTFSLAVQSTAICGNETNVLVAAIPTTQGVLYRESASNVLQPNQWQSIILTWTNGQEANLYINGELDQPGVGFVTTSGVLTNCPQFVVGRGPVNTPSWGGGVDEVEVFPYALNPLDIIALAQAPVTNHGPVVVISPDTEVQVGVPVTIWGSVTDDGLPNPPGQVTFEWSEIGTNSVDIPDPESLTNTFVFSTPGQYTFRLTASDSQITSFADTTVTVLPPTEVSIANSGGDAYDMGPVDGQYTLTRTGSTNELTVYLGFSGTASNGVNYVEITNAFTFPAGTNSIDIPLDPILDYNIKGDQTATATVLTNIAYTVDGDPASITIHDSPYGTWSIANFSLEELTFPYISAAWANPAGDGLVNFVKYAFDLDPKEPEPNPSFQYGLVNDTNSGLNYLTLTYTRWQPPRVVAYGVYISNDLMNWNTGTNYVEELSSTPDSNGATETVTARVVAPMSTATNLFMTIRVWLAQVPTDGP